MASAALVTRAAATCRDEARTDGARAFQDAVGQAVLYQFASTLM
jgi:hypothetical protein